MADAPTPSQPSGDNQATEFVSLRAGAAVFADVLRPRGMPVEAAGDHVGLYRLVEKIGDGGFGSVWRAEQTEPMRREVALKIIKLGMDTLEVMARFEQERQALALMDHPNIARVLDGGATPEGRPFFVMEVVRGPSITAYCVDKQLGLRQRLELFKDVCSGVQHAHQKGIIHRDLKPSNILVTEHDGVPVPKIIDFGIAKAMTHDRLTEFTLVTRSEQMIGTPLYMSPEQVSVGSDIDTRCDVYSLGVLLYELLAGQPPFDVQTLHTAGYEEMRRIIRDVDPPRPSERLTSLVHKGRPGLTTTAADATALRGDLDWIVMKAVEKDREQRYASPTALAEDLQRYLGAEPISARPPTLSYVARRWVRRHKVAAFTTLICTLAIAVGTSLAIWQALRATAAQTTAETNAYYATLANALAQRGRSDFAAARRMLAEIPSTRRGFEWQLIHGLCEGDDEWAVNPGGGVPECIAWDPAGKKVIALMTNRRLCFIDPKIGRSVEGPRVPEVPAESHKDEVGRGFRNLAISPDGRHYACGDGDVVIIGELAGGKIIHTARSELAEMQWLDADRLVYGWFSLAALGPEDISGHVFKISTGKDKALPHGISGPFAVSLDGKRVAWVRHNRMVVVRRIEEELLESAPEMFVESDRGGHVQYLSLNSDGSQVAAAWQHSQSSEVAVFAVPEGRQVFNQTQPLLSTLALCPDQPLLADSETQPWLRTWRYLEDIPEPAIFDDGGLSTNDPYHAGGPYTPPTQLLTHSAQQGRAGFMFGHEAAVTGLKFLPDEEAIISSSRDGTVRRWPFKSTIPERHRLTNVKTRHEWNHPGASPDGNCVFYLDHEDGCARLWDRSTGRRTSFPAGHASLVALNDGRAVTRIGATGELVVWQTKDNTPAELWRTQGIPSHSKRFSQVVRAVLSADGRRIAAQLPGRLLVLDLDTRKTHGTDDQRMSFGPLGVQGLDLSPDGGKIVATGFLGRRARLYSADDLTQPFATLVAEDAPITHDSTAVFSRDGTRLYVGNHDGWVRVFDPLTGKERAEERWQAHTSVVSALAISRSGEIIATASDGNIILWDAIPDAQGQRRERLRLPAKIARNWIHFAENDRALLHGAPWEPVEIWQAKQ